MFLTDITLELVDPYQRLRARHLDTLSKCEVSELHLRYLEPDQEEAVH